LWNIRRQQARDASDELGTYLAGWTGCPLHLAESIRHQGVGIVDPINDQRHDECPLSRHEVGAIHCQLPLESKVSL